MIFLADIIDDGPSIKVRDTKKDVTIYTKEKVKNKKTKANKSNKKRPLKKTTRAFTRLANKTVGIAGSVNLSQSEIAIVRSMAANNINTPLKRKTSKQKTIGAKKSTSFYRKEK